MKSISKKLLSCSLLALAPVVADAAGTYYNGAYQSPQTRYAQQGYAQQGYAQRSRNYSQQGVSSYARNQYANAGYSAARSAQNGRQPMPNMQNKTVGQSATDQGFSLGAGISRQAAMWNFEMKNAESILHYDNIDWNVLDVDLGYNFNVGNTAMRISAGFDYGMQAGESTMIDDDITNGGYFVTEWGEDTDNDGVADKVLGNQMGRALSIGTAQDGSMMGFNASIGLTNAFKLGNLKITPTVGWRYLKYSLETHNNHGIAIDTFDGAGGCVSLDGEVQCDPVLIFYDSAGNQYLATRSDTNNDGSIDLNDEIEVPSGYEFVNTGGTYYYGQDGISHKYDVTWSGPYVALDMQYDINQNNYMKAFVELGLPSYTATGDQPYRFDWQHPKSVEDSAGLGSALHMGLGANWATSISDKVMLTIGVTYDYYSVSDADAQTFLNGNYYEDIYDSLLQQWQDAGYTETDMLNPTTGDPVALNIKELESECPGWICTDSGEIESFYKSLGVRVGINAKF